MSYAIKMIEVECDDGVHDFPKGISAGEVVKEIHGKKSGVIAALVNGEEKDLSYSLQKTVRLTL